MENKVLDSRILKFLKDSPKTLVGLILIAIVFILTLGAPLFTSIDPMMRFEGAYHNPPSAEHLLGTTRLGRDVWAQTLYGGRISLMVGAIAGSIAVALSLVIGISSGYFGGKIDSIITTIINIIMVIPSTVLLLVIAALVGKVSPVAIGVIIGLTNWAWGARMFRAQTLSLKHREFVFSAETLGESKVRILFVEIMPNMLAMIASAFVGTIIFAIGMQQFLEFIGFGDSTSVTWGNMLYNAQKTGALNSGIWWEILGPSGAVVILGAGLTMINFAIDEVSNPKLRAQRIMRTYYKEKKIQEKLDKKRMGQKPKESNEELDVEMQGGENR